MMETIDKPDWYDRAIAAIAKAKPTPSGTAAGRK